ncbi:MAG: SGNH/GDSL hydrolase family protein [Clostridia bacterium]|nr:SGNH/GDSL hydrolase family protein [Clostridia bacterium]MBR3681658.1 SGNH/GDSL hydrolase family protein [Clostridia bacterium]
MNRLPKNARAVFIGDSITAANLTLPYVIHAHKQQCPDLGIRFFNCGVAGGTAEFALTSYETDIKRYKPTHAFISFGINDSRRELLASPRTEERFNSLVSCFERYKANLRALTKRLLSDGVNVTLCTPAPYDEYSDSEQPPLRGGFALMQGYADFVRSLAREIGVGLIDIHERLSRQIQHEPLISPDRIHPTEHGYFVLAKIILEHLGLEAGEEAPLPEYFSRWRSYVARLRKVLAAECMIVNDFHLPTEQKLLMMRARVENEDWIQPIFESYIRDYVADKPNEAELYRMIDLTYEEDVF